MEIPPWLNILLKIVGVSTPIFAIWAQFFRKARSARPPVDLESQQGIPLAAPTPQDPSSLSFPRATQPAASEAIPHPTPDPSTREPAQTSTTSPNSTSTPAQNPSLPQHINQSNPRLVSVVQLQRPPACLVRAARRVTILVRPNNPAVPVA